MITLVGFPQTDPVVIGTFDYGQLRDVTSPGAGDGSPWRKDIAQDIYYAIAAVCKAGGQAPNGSTETTSSSQFLNAIKEIGKSVTGNFSVTGTGGFGGLLTASAGLSVTGAGSVSGLLTLSATSNQLKLSGATLSYGSSTARTLTIPTVSGASSFVMTTENQTIGGEKTFSGLLTASAGIDVGDNNKIKWGTNPTNTDYAGLIASVVGDYLYIDGGRGATNGVGAKGLRIRPINGQSRGIWNDTGLRIGDGVLPTSTLDVAGTGSFSGLLTASAGLSVTSGVISTPSAISIGQSATASGEISTALGYGSTASGSYSTALGYDSTASDSSSTALGRSATASGYYSTALGRSATASGYNSTALGYNSKASGISSTALGYDSTALVDNRMTLGNSSTNVYLGSGSAVTSDQRDKIDIEDNELGLDFLNKVRTAKYKINHRDRYYKRDEDSKLILTDNGQPIVDEEEHTKGTKKGKRIHRGVIAQELEKLIDTTEFSAVKHSTVNNANQYDDYAVDYIQFIPVLIKAIQELSDKVEEQEKLIQKLRK